MLSIRSALATVSAVAAVCLATPAFAENAPSPVLGLGAAVSGPSLAFMKGATSSVTTGFALSDFSVPIRVLSQLRVEPTIGLLRQSNTSDTPASGTSTPASSSDEVFSNVRIGTGVFYDVAVAENTRVYVGPRLGLSFNSSTSTSTYSGKSSETKKSSTDVTLGLSAGSEYYLSPRFSLGAEILVSYVMVGQATKKVDGVEIPATGDKSQSMLSTNSFLFVRWYFL